MKRSKLSLSDNPVFETVTGLTNTTFDPNNIVEGRMATEAQIKQIEERIMEVEADRDYCCRDIVVWKTFTRVVSTSGIVLSNFIENVVVDTARRGLPFTVTFAPKFNSNTYMYFSKPGTNESGSSDSHGKCLAIYYTTADKTQDQRNCAQYILVNSNSMQTTATGAMSDVRETCPGGSSPIPLPNVTNAYTLVPYDYDMVTNGINYEDANFKVYLQNDGTITVDIKNRSIYRGVNDAFPNDPAYTCIFALQLVQKV